LRYLPKSESERRQMLDACGVSSPEELFAHLPEEVRLKRPLSLDPGISEYEIVQYFVTARRKTPTGTLPSWAPACTTTIARFWWIRWSHGASS